MASTIEVLLEIAENIWIHDKENIAPNQEETKKAAQKVITLIEQSTYSTATLFEMANLELATKIEYSRETKNSSQVLYYRNLQINVNFIYGAVMNEMSSSTIR